jgi:hypothetical protein
MERPKRLDKDPADWTEEEYRQANEAAKEYELQSVMTYHALEDLNLYEGIHGLPFTEWETLHDDDEARSAG